MLGLFLLGFLAKKVTNFEAKIAAAFGLLLIAMMSFKESLPEALQIPLESKMTVVVGTLSIVAMGIALRKFKRS
jgi:SSS family solute:Na+ symporter